jgi:cytosine/adenosine deaminase-related metal-dependent hydrolase
MAEIVLKNGTALIHAGDEHVQAVKTDILIKGQKIVKIANDISAPNATIIDCTDKIISPGFIDTHHHVWQTQLRGRHGDQNLIEYLPSGRFVGKVFEAEDMFWGQREYLTNCANANANPNGQSVGALR